MIDVKKTKTGILSVAFKGALVEFESKDSKNVELEEIHKLNKKYIPVSEKEYLVDAPTHWNWTRLGYVVSNHGQTTPTDTFSYIDVGTMDNVHQKLSKVENIVEAKDAPSRARKIVEMDDVLYSTVRPYLHNICIVDKQFSKMPIASTAFCVMHANEKVLNNRYLFYWLLSAEFDSFSNGNPSKGTLYPAIGEKDLLNGVIPLPSVQEQEEIVTRIEESFNALEQLEIALMSYVEDIEILKCKLFDAGIQGKLTEQLSEDGTAEELYTLIQKEKKQILKVRKGREDKSIKEVDVDVPYELPVNWKWVRFGEIGLFKKGPFGSALTKSMFVPKTDDTVKVYEQQHAIQKNSELGTYYITREYFDEKMSGFEVLPGDIIVSCAGTIGETYILPDDIEQGIINQALMRVSLVPSVNKRFFQYYFDANLKKTAQEESNGSAIKNIPPFDVMKNWYFPLPPYAEQVRIVEKLDELLSLM
ncbi:MAG: restriction endonuclease subunit S [Lachnospiraceae bacterium]|nr:restriction endonuclease subunit S [Lachnospiraceae bacterium]